jgi:hypothetical protein
MTPLLDPRENQKKPHTLSSCKIGNLGLYLPSIPNKSKNLCFPGLALATGQSLLRFFET